MFEDRLMDLQDEYLAKPLFDELSLMFDDHNFAWFYQSDGCYYHLLYDNQSPTSDAYQVMDQIFGRRTQRKQWVKIQVVTYGRGDADVELPVIPSGKGSYTSLFFLNDSDAKIVVGDETIDFVKNRIVEFEGEIEIKSSPSSKTDRSILVLLNYF